MQLDPKQIKEKQERFKNQETAFNLLVPAEKTKVRVCAKWNFYSLKCKTCNHKLICAEQWKIKDWLD